jgi:quercetin dioxygenase-like cupin family protein
MNESTPRATVPNVVRFGELTQPQNAVPLMFIDSVLPGHQRMNWAVIGDTASENPDYKPAITAPHRFQIGVFMCPPNSGPAWHMHDYIELFLPLGGKWRFHYGSSADGTEDGHVDLDPFDIISLPPGTWRSFENISDGPAFCFAVLESHEVFSGKDPYWGTQVIKQAADRGFAATDKGEMIKPADYEVIERQVTADLVAWLNKAR